MQTNGARLPVVNRCSLAHVGAAAYSSHAGPHVSVTSVTLKEPAFGVKRLDSRDPIPLGGVGKSMPKEPRSPPDAESPSDADKDVTVRSALDSWSRTARLCVIYLTVNVPLDVLGPVGQTLAGGRRGVGLALPGTRHLYVRHAQEPHSVASEAKNLS